MLTLAERATAYAAAFPQYPASHLQLVEEHGQPVLYGRWVLGQNYRRKHGYYGEYPPGYLARVMALFPDVPERHANEWTTLHVFSGSVPRGPYLRCDMQQPADYQCGVVDLPADLARRGRPPFRLVIADPPYSDADAAKYGTPMIDRAKAMRALAKVTARGGHLVWLDCVWPMFSKSDWRTVGRIAITRSTNHRIRDCSIFERQG